MTRTKTWPLFPQEQPEAIQGMPAPDNSQLPEPDFDIDEDEINLAQECPNCGLHYDEVDYEYQICHYCKFDNNN